MSRKNKKSVELNEPTFADFFAGIGGIRLGFEHARFKCVYSNEIDPFCAITYKANFGDDPTGDITRVIPEELPDFDVFVGGFPCQAFSIAGRKLGFEDTRGTLFFKIAGILKAKRPKAFLLENVKNLKRHDQGKTFATILNVLQNDLDYNVSFEIRNAKDFGVPQNRERVYIVGFRKDVFNGKFEFPNGKKHVPLKKILEKHVPLKYFISKVRFEGMKRHRARHEAKGHGFGYEVLDPNGVSKAIVVGGMGRERNLIRDLESFNEHRGEPGFEKKNTEGLRVLTPREYARLQGYKQSFKIPVSNAQAYKQFANSVAVPVIYQIATKINDLICSRSTALPNRPVGLKVKLTIEKKENKVPLIQTLQEINNGE
jgi:DNA (cytosine-5)-methyltransferase 1